MYVEQNLFTNSTSQQSPHDPKSTATQIRLLHPTNGQFCHLIQKTSEFHCWQNEPNGQHCTKTSSTHSLDLILAKHLLHNKLQQFCRINTKSKTFKTGRQTTSFLRSMAFEFPFQLQFHWRYIKELNKRLITAGNQ